MSVAACGLAPNSVGLTSSGSKLDVYAIISVLFLEAVCAGVPFDASDSGANVQSEIKLTFRSGLMR